MTEENIAGPYALIVADIKRCDPPGNLRSQMDNIGLDEGVVGARPGIRRKMTSVPKTINDTITAAANRRPIFFFIHFVSCEIRFSYRTQQARRRTSAKSPIPDRGSAWPKRTSSIPVLIAIWRTVTVTRMPPAAQSIHDGKKEPRMSCDGTWLQPARNWLNAVNTNALNQYWGSSDAAIFHDD